MTGGDEVKQEKPSKYIRLGWSVKARGSLFDISKAYAGASPIAEIGPMIRVEKSKTKHKKPFSFIGSIRESGSLFGDRKNFCKTSDIPVNRALPKSAQWLQRVKQNKKTLPGIWGSDPSDQKVRQFLRCGPGEGGWGWQGDIDKVVPPSEL